MTGKWWGRHFSGLSLPKACLPWSFLSFSLLLSTTLAEDKKEEKKKEPPKITNISPLTLLPTTHSIKIRGQNLAEATAITITTNNAQATIKSKSKSDAPKPFDAQKAGDSEIQLDLKIATEALPGDLTFTLTTPTGQTAPYTIKIADPATTTEEKEPNNSFKTAQELPLGKTVLGAIQEQSDVDVYKFTATKPNTKIIAEIIAERKGSLLDASITLYDAAGHVLATADDSENSRDPILKSTLPAEGLYYLAVTDANDHASATHAYILTLREDR
jgi:Bacterial pre-peptidase C-terminal domain